jgi:glycosyltransferase involved in cell wall biosynthesis
MSLRTPSIYFDLRGMFSFPVSNEIRMAGMIRCMIEWSKIMASDPTVAFVCPGFSHLMSDALSKIPGMSEVSAKLQLSARREFSETLCTRLPVPMSRRDLAARVRRKVAHRLQTSLFALDTKNLLQNLGENHASIYFQPSVFPLPASIPERCIPVMNVYDLIPLVFKNKGQIGDPIYAASIQSVSRLGGHFIVNSHHVRHSLVCMFDVPVERVHVVSLGALPPSPTPDVGHSIPEHPYFLLISGDCQRRKNVEGTVRAFARYCDQSPTPYELRIIGPSEEDLHRIKANYAGRWGHRIFGEGKVTEVHLDHLIRHAKWGLYLSLYEGFGLPPLEFMSRGIPVIASSATSVPESVGNAGILVDPLDHVAIAATMLKVTQNPDLAAGFISIGLHRAADFSWQRSGESLTAAFNGIFTMETTSCSTQ